MKRSEPLASLDCVFIDSERDVPFAHVFSVVLRRLQDSGLYRLTDRLDVRSDGGRPTSTCRRLQYVGPTDQIEVDGTDASELDGELGGLFVLCSWAAADVTQAVHWRYFRASVVECDRGTFGEMLRQLQHKATADSVRLPWSITRRLDSRLPRLDVLVNLQLIERLAQDCPPPQTDDPDDDDGSDYQDIMAQAYEAVYGDAAPIESAPVAEPRPTELLRHEFSDRLYAADGRPHPKLVRRFALVLQTAATLIDFRGLAEFRSAEHFYLHELCLMQARGPPIGDLKRTFAKIVDRKLAFWREGASQFIPASVAEYLVQTGSRQTRHAEQLFDDRLRLDRLLDRHQMLAPSDSIRASARLVRCSFATVTELRRFVDENMLLTTAEVLRQNEALLSVILRLSAKEASPLALTSSVRVFCPSALDGVDFYVVWAPSQYELVRRAINCRSRTDVYVCMTRAVWRALSLGAVPRVAIVTGAAVPAPLTASITLAAALHSGERDVVSNALVALQHLVCANQRTVPVVWRPGHENAALDTIDNLDRLLALLAGTRADREERRTALVEAIADPIVQLHRDTINVLPTESALAAVHATIASRSSDLYVGRDQLQTIAHLLPDEMRQCLPAASADATRRVCYCGMTSDDCELMRLPDARPICCVCARDRARARRKKVPNCAGCTRQREVGASICIYDPNRSSCDPIRALIDINARDALYSLRPGLLGRVYPVVFPFNSAPESSTPLVRLPIEQPPVADSRAELLLCMIVALQRLASIGRTSLAEDLRPLCPLSRNEQFDAACNATSVVEAASRVAQFPLCPSLLAETCNEGAYSLESSASNLLLSLPDRVERSVVQANVARPLTDSMPLLMPLVFANFHSNYMV